MPNVQGTTFGMGVLNGNYTQTLDFPVKLLYNECAPLGLPPSGLEVHFFVF